MTTSELLLVQVARQRHHKSCRYFIACVAIANAKMTDQARSDLMLFGGGRLYTPHLRGISHHRRFTKSKSLSRLTATTASSRTTKESKTAKVVTWENTETSTWDSSYYRVGVECVPRLVQPSRNARKRRNGKLAGASCAANRPDATPGCRGWWPNQGSGYRNCFTVCGSSIRSPCVHTDRCLLLLFLMCSVLSDAIVW